MQFGEGLSMEEGYAQMNYAYERGVNFFDSAEMYPVPQNAKSHGRSEQCLVRLSASFMCSLPEKHQPCELKQERSS